MGGCGCKGNYNIGDLLSGYEGGEYNYKYKTKTKKPCYVRFIDACMTRAAKTNASKQSKTWS